MILCASWFESSSSHMNYRFIYAILMSSKINQLMLKDRYMPVIRTTKRAMEAGNRPEWCKVTSAGIFKISAKEGRFDVHYHDCNEYWLICKGTLPIPGAKNTSQAAMNAAAAGWRLTEDQVAALDEVSDGLTKA